MKQQPFSIYCEKFELDNFVCHIDVAACDAGIRALLVRSVYQIRSDLARHAGQADGETRRGVVNAMS